MDPAVRNVQSHPAFSNPVGLSTRLRPPHQLARCLAWASSLALFLVIAATVVPAPALAQDATALPLCPASEETLITTVPEVVRRGLSYEISSDTSPSVSDAALAIGFTPADPAADQESDAFALLLGEKLIRAAPLKNGTLAFEFSWIESAGTPAACRAYDRYSTPVIGPKATVGDSDAPRIAGRYRARYSKTTPATWTLRPRCDVFGCTTDVRSSGGFRAALEWDPSTNAYTAERRYTTGYCAVTYEDGRTAKWRIFEYRTVTLRPRTVNSDDLATLLVGSRKTQIDAPSDATGACQRTTTTYERLTLRAIER